MRRGRKSRQQNPAIASAVKPGMLGGRYRPLTGSDEEKIHKTVLDVLENIGMADPIPLVKKRALKRGCFINEDGRLCFPRALVEDVIANILWCSDKVTSGNGKRPGGARSYVACYWTFTDAPT